MTSAACTLCLGGAQFSFFSFVAGSDVEETLTFTSAISGRRPQALVRLKAKTACTTIVIVSILNFTRPS
jgi:hypothetical protein